MDIDLKIKPSDEVTITLHVSKETVAEWYKACCEEEPDIPDVPDTPEEPDIPDTPDEPVEPVIPVEGRSSFEDMIAAFNEILVATGHEAVTPDKEVYGYMNWEFNFATREWDSPESPYFDKANVPEIYDYNGTKDTYAAVAYNAMQAWLIASQLAEYVPTYGETTNTQTELFKFAYNACGANEVPIYGGFDIRSDINKVREAAAYICAYCHQEYSDEQIARFREELGGEMIPASNWDELGYANEMLTDEYGKRGYEMTNLGYLVNTQNFMPKSPGPKVPGTTVCDIPYPYEESEPYYLFNLGTGNYLMDEEINRYMVKDYNMMAQTPLEEWNSYSEEKQQHIVNAMATIPCTYQYLFGKPKAIELKLENGELPIVDGYPRYVFNQVGDSPLVLEGPFSDLAGIYRYNCDDHKNELESFLSTVLDIADNFRFPTQDPSYGRCRPGCACTRQGGELNPIHGSKENELYNISISCLVADTEEQKQRWADDDGFASDSPRSYVSGHSAQAVAMALLLSQINPDKTIDYMRRAHQYSVNRSIARFHWNSDCIQGRIFGTMAAPILRAMSGLQDGLKAVKEWIENPQPVPEGDWTVKLIIKNLTGEPIDSTGEIRMYAEGHIGINTYLPGAKPEAGALYTFEVGENDFSDSDVHCVLNSETYMDDAYEGVGIEEVRFYDYRHWNNTDAGYSIMLDTEDERCDTVFRKAGATYVLKIENI